LVNQRDIVEVYFDGAGIHPVVVISNNLIHEVEDYFIGVMMTSKSKNDEFSFVLNDEMTVKPMKKKHSEVRCHLISYFPIENINSTAHHNSLTIKAFKKLIAKINDTSFSTKNL
jgi:mRNA-degrading endonuclease toxin of MazEF toxin-antitoxin module